MTAVALSAEARWLAIGRASGRVTFVAADTLEAIWDHVPSDSASPIAAMTLQHHESMHTLEASTALTSYRDGSIQIWNVARKEAKVASSQTHLDPRLRWRAVKIGHAQSSTNSESGSSATSTTSARHSSASLRWKVSSTSERSRRSFQRQDGLHPQSGGSRSRLLCAPLQDCDSTTIHRRGASSQEHLLLGLANGQVRLIDFETAEAVSSVDLEDGPVNGLFSVDAGDANTSAFIARRQAGPRFSLYPEAQSVHQQRWKRRVPCIQLERLYGRLPTSYSHAQWISHQCCQLLGRRRLDSAEPRSRTRQSLAYPMSSHGSASRLRRASAHNRDRSGTGGGFAESSSQGAAASSSLSIFPNLPPPSNSTLKADDRQLRLLGWVRCQRGGSFVSGSQSRVVGIGRALRATGISRGSGGRLTCAMSLFWDAAES